MCADAREENRMSSAQPAVDFESATDLPALYELLDQVQVKNGWAKAVPVMVREPKQVFVPHRWRFADMRAALHVAGRLVGTEWAERRNLIMANPFPGNDYATVPTLVGAYQMVKAGETARSHRHTPNAMRIVLEAGPQTATIVDGVKITMEPGDVLLTPNWCWHGHANEGGQDAYWVDFLDSPLTAAIGPMFFQHHPDEVESASRGDAPSALRFAFADYQRGVQAAPEVAPGVRQLVLGPATLVTFDRVVVHLAGGARWQPDRSTANQVYTVVQGSGSSRIGEREFTWQRGDMIAAPAWQDQQHSASADTILLRVSDEPLMRMLGWYHTGAGMAAAKGKA
jgi:gentisate 1,2-dioxygenase